MPQSRQPATTLSAADAASVGMGLAVTAREHPDRPAIVSSAGDRSYAALNARINQLARALRSRGLRAGDAVGLVCSNRPEFAETVQCAQRIGLRFTPINWHLTADEIAYVLGDCEARAFVADSRFAEACAGAAAKTPALVARLAVGGAEIGRAHV